MIGKYSIGEKLSAFLVNPYDALEISWNSLKNVKEKYCWNIREYLWSKAHMDCWVPPAQLQLPSNSW